MKTYTKTITAEESAKVYRALSRGLWCARQLDAQGVIGAGSYAAQIEEALAIMNRPCDGGYVNEQERNAAFHNWMDKECAKYGCD